MAGIFGKMFDFNKNGKLDAGETAAELLFLDMITQREHDAEDGEDGEPFTAYDSEVNVDEDGEDEASVTVRVVERFTVTAVFPARTGTIRRFSPRRPTISLRRGSCAS